MKERKDFHIPFEEYKETLIPRFNAKIKKDKKQPKKFKKKYYD